MFKVRKGIFGNYYVHNKEADIFALNNGAILDGSRIDSGLFTLEEVEQFCYYQTEAEANDRALNLNK